MEQSSPETLHVSKRTDILAGSLALMGVGMTWLLGPEWGWPFLIAGVGGMVVYFAMWRTRNPVWVNQALIGILIVFILSSGSVITWKLLRPVPILAAKLSVPVVPSEQELTDAFARTWFEYERLHPVAHGAVVSNQIGAAIGSVVSTGQTGGTTAGVVNSAPGGIANSGVIGQATIFAEKQRTISDDDKKMIMDAMRPFAGHPINIWVQIPYTHEMDNFGSVLAESLTSAGMQAHLDHVNLTMTSCQGDNGIAFFGPQFDLSRLPSNPPPPGYYFPGLAIGTLTKALVSAKLMDKVVSYCAYGNYDSLPFVWINRP